MTQNDNQPKLALWPKRRSSWKLLFYLVVLALLAYAIVPKYHQLVQGVKEIGNANTNWLLLAVMMIVLTHCAAAFVYVILTKHPIKYLKTLAVQIAASFTNRLLPSGIGGISLFIDYLIKKGHKPAEATSVTAMNSVAAISSHFVLLLGALAIGHGALGTVSFSKSLSFRSLALAAIIILLVLWILWRRRIIRQKIIKFAKETWVSIADYRHHGFKLIFATLAAAAITISYVLAFWACTRAIGVPITIVQAFLTYTFAVALGAAALTPGGLGGVEAGLVAGIVAFGYNTTLAFSAVIIYRLITFWMPILPGYLAFWLLRRDRAI